jgi:hypothetical protein
LRADHILAFGPDPKFVVGGDAVDGFSTAPDGGPYLMGSPEDYARGKARLFPAEGGPAILEIEVPAAIIVLALQPGGEVWFGEGYGLEELLSDWPKFAKRVFSL